MTKEQLLALVEKDAVIDRRALQAISTKLGMSIKARMVTPNTELVKFIFDQAVTATDEQIEGIKAVDGLDYSLISTIFEKTAPSVAPKKVGRPKKETTEEAAAEPVAPVKVAPAKSGDAVTMELRLEAMQKQVDIAAAAAKAANDKADEILRQIDTLNKALHYVVCTSEATANLECLEDLRTRGE